MISDELKYKITSVLPASVYDETGEFLNVLIDSSDWLVLAKELRYDKDLDFDYLFCLTCIDWKDHLMMVYHLLSKQHKHSLVIKARISDCDLPEIESVCNIWKTADFHEREVFDLFGVNFLHHPDLRRLFLTDDWKGFPLRKNYTDVNMIEL